ncbi:MAG TPA: maleylacetate reductase [Candidatus Limnocylindrales bacterium]
MEGLRFVYRTNAARVVFGPGSISELQGEVEELGATRALVVCSGSGRAVADAVAARLESRCVGVFDRATMHVPIEVAREARTFAAARGADVVIAIGGGSAIGLAKAIALETAIPIVAVPTTYAGSEMTPIFGLTEAARKRTGRDPRVLPRTVIYDPELSRTLPLEVAIPSAFNAIAHAAEGLYAPDANPIASLMAEEAVRAIASALPGLVEAPNDPEPRSRLLYGAWLAGTVLGTVQMGLHHRICHVLGGRLDLPHAETHAVVLPHVLAWNAPAAPVAMTRIGRALGVHDAPAGLHGLALGVGAPTSLRALGMTDGDVDGAADEIVASPPANPRSIDRDELRGLLARALDGRLETGR